MTLVDTVTKTLTDSVSLLILAFKRFQFTIDERDRPVTGTSRARSFQGFAFRWGMFRSARKDMDSCWANWFQQVAVIPFHC